MSTPSARALACGMAFLAGSVDVVGLARTGVFVSFMSGNTTTLGTALGKSDGMHAWTVGRVILLFVAGAVLGALLAELAGGRHATVILVAAGMLLSLPLARTGWTEAGLALAMGVLTAATDRVGATGVSLTYVTGTLVKVAQGAGRWLAGRRGDAGWGLQLQLYFSFLAGAVSAAAAQARFGEAHLWALPALALLLASAAAVLPPSPPRGPRPAANTIQSPAASPL
ncbi:MAG: DUF1275 family protein [Gemmatimonadetes bacterium]|nr:DUF1275 family protein [Gemmatimonadota bacterium]